MKVKVAARIDAPNSDPLDIQVAALSVGDLLFIEYRASGGNVKLIVRKGPTVLEWHWLAQEWVDARELADGSAGRGLQNPIEVLDFLLANADAATDGAAAGGRRVLKLALNGERIRPLLKEQVEEREVRWGDSTSEATIELAPATNLPTRITSSASLAWKKDQSIKYRGEVVVESYGQDTEFRFFERDRKNNPIREIVLKPDDRKKLGLLPK
jgi:hypothetical protein